MENGVFRVQIYTKEYEQMRHFYGTVLRLPVLVCRETGRDDRVCVYGAASGQIEVIYAPPGMEVPASNGWTLQMQIATASSFRRKAGRFSGSRRISSGGIEILKC